MTQGDGLDYVPEHVSKDAERKLRELTKESEPQQAPLEVNEYLIRHWCETLEDGNPLYLDEEYAKSQGFHSIVAPPGSVMTAFSLPYRWPWPSTTSGPARHIHYEIKDLLELPVGIITNIEMEYGEPLEVGDRVSVSQRLVSISPWKKTRLGEGHFWTMDRLYRNQDGALLARERMTAFGYGRGPGERRQDGGGWSPAVEEVIKGEETGYSPRQFSDRIWEDVNEGDELPELKMPITLTRCAYLASATRDFSPQHSNRDYAQERSKAKDVFVNTPFNIGMLSRFMTDWGGPKSTVRRINLAMRGNVCANDDMIITGSVSRKYVDNGDYRVDLDILISTQEGPVSPCNGTLALPSRSDSTE